MWCDKKEKSIWSKQLGMMKISMWLSTILLKLSGLKEHSLLFLMMLWVDWAKLYCYCMGQNQNQSQVSDMSRVQNLSMHLLLRSLHSTVRVYPYLLHIDASFILPYLTLTLSWAFSQFFPSNASWGWSHLKVPLGWTSEMTSSLIYLLPSLVTCL